MNDHQLLVFLIQVAVLVAAARLGGLVASRLGIPEVVGELAFGLILGPSLLGKVWPAAYAALFPPDPVQRTLLDIMSWIGVLFLVLIGGLEARLGVLRRTSKAVVGGWAGGFGFPFLAGFALGMVFPARLVPTGIEQPIFALFIATAMSISAIPVIARILMDLNLYRTRMGMIILSTALADDTVGWIVLSIVAGLAAGGVTTSDVVTMVSLTAAFIALAFTVGRRLVRHAMKFSHRRQVPYAQASMMFVLVFAFAAITQAIGVHLVLGAFVAAILIGRLERVDREAVASIRHVGMAFFVPIFFAYTGVKVNLTSLSGEALVFAALAVLVACLGKVVGGSLGASLGGLPMWEALAVGFGLNARGAMELVIAAIGLSIGVLNDASYAVIVLIAVLTTLMAAPMLKFCVSRAGVAALDPAVNASGSTLADEDRRMRREPKGDRPIRPAR
jgi:Kef-type K+ transport system membrane component KefB